MNTRTSLRVEGAAVFLAALAGPEVGALTYNPVHVYARPLVPLAGSLLTGVEPLAWGGAVWAGHIGGL